MLFQPNKKTAQGTLLNMSSPHTTYRFKNALYVFSSAFSSSSSVLTVCRPSADPHQCLNKA